MIAAVAMMVSCTGNSNGSGSQAAGDQAAGFSVQNGISGTTGTKNCHLVGLGVPITFEVAGEGDILDVTAKVKVQYKAPSDTTQKVEVEDMTKPAELWISGRDDDNKDVKLTLMGEEDTKTKFVEWLKTAPKDEYELIFKAKLPKADMDKLNAKQCTNTLVI